MRNLFKAFKGKWNEFLEQHCSSWWKIMFIIAFTMETSVVRHDFTCNQMCQVSSLQKIWALGGNVRLTVDATNCVILDLVCFHYFLDLTWRRLGDSFDLPILIGSKIQTSKNLGLCISCLRWETVNHNNKIWNSNPFN